MKTWKTVMVVVNTFILVLMAWSFHAMRGARDALQQRVVMLGAVNEEMAKACATECVAKVQASREEGRKEGYFRGAEDAREMVKEATAMTRPKCNHALPPYQPCCGEDVPGEAVKPDDFRNGHTLTLSCAHATPETGAPWVCARTADKCMASKRRSGACSTCVVHLASGRLAGEDFVWTGHAIDEMDGPWTADGKRGVFP